MKITRKITRILLEGLPTFLIENSIIYFSFPRRKKIILTMRDFEVCSYYKSPSPGFRVSIKVENRDLTWTIISENLPLISSIMILISDKQSPNTKRETENLNSVSYSFSFHNKAKYNEESLELCLLYMKNLTERIIPMFVFP